MNIDKRENIFILHSLNGDTINIWGQDIKENFNKQNIEVILPQFPIRSDSTYEKFEEILKVYLDNKTLNENSIVICHSIGNAYFIRFCKEMNYIPKAYIAVAPGAVYNIPSNRNDYIVKVKAQAYCKQEELDFIKENLDIKYCLYSDEDEPKEEMFKKFIEDTNSIGMYLKYYNHFDGYHRIYKIPELTELITKILYQNKDIDKSKYKKGLILIYPGYQNEAKQYQYNRITEEFEKLGIKIDKIKVDEIIIDIENGKSNLHFDEYDFCIQLVRDKYINALLEKNNIRSFNTYEVTENCDDKFMTYCLLADNDIKMPTTISGITNTGVENITQTEISEEYKNYVEKKLGYPLIAKKSNSKGGRDIYKIDNREMLNDACNKLNGSQYVFQEFISSNVGKDIRTVIVGGKLVGSIMRINENDFRSNISLGGKSISYTVTEEYKKVAEKVARILKLDYCSVDFFITQNNEPIICEVNADPALTAIEKLGEINVAKIYAEYIFNEIYNN